MSSDTVTSLMVPPVMLRLVVMNKPLTFASGTNWFTENVKLVSLVCAQAAPAHTINPAVIPNNCFVFIFVYLLRLKLWVRSAIVCSGRDHKAQVAEVVRVYEHPVAGRVRRKYRHPVNQVGRTLDRILISRDAGKCHRDAVARNCDRLAAAKRRSCSDGDAYHTGTGALPIADRVI